MSARPLYLLLTWCLALACPAAGGPLPDDPKPAKQEPPRTDRHGDPLPEGAIARLGTVRLRHQASVFDVLFSADGKRLISAGHDGRVSVWDPRSGRELQRFPVLSSDQHPAPWGCLSPDGKILVTRNRTFHFWDLQTGRELPWSPGKRAAREELSVAGATFSADGKRLLVMGQAMRTVLGGDAPPLVFWIYDVGAGKLLRRLTESQRAFWGVGRPPPFALLPDCRVLVDSLEGGLTVREVGANKVVLRQAGKSSLLFSPDGKGVYAVGDGTLALLDLATARARYRLPDFDPNRAFSIPVVSGDGRSALARVWRGKPLFRVWDTATGKTLREFPCQGDGPSALALSRDGRLVAAADGGGTVKVWAVPGGEAIGKFPLQTQGAPCLAFSPDGKLLAVGGGPAVCLWDLRTGRRALPPGGHEQEPQSLAFAPDGKSLASMDTGATTLLWELPAGREKARFTAPAERPCVQQLFWGGDGRLLALAHRSGLSVSPGHPDPPEIVRVWEPLTGKRRLGLANALQGALALAVAADGRSLAVARGDRVCLWDLEAGKVPLSIPLDKEPNEPGPNGFPPQAGGAAPGFSSVPVTSLSLSADGRLLAGLASTVARDGTGFRLPLWEAATGKERGRLKWKVGPSGLHNSGRGGNWPVFNDLPEAVLLTPDARGAAVSSKETVRLVRLKDGVEIRRFGGPAVEAKTVRFSPDGRHLAAATTDGGVQLWEVATGTAVVTLRSPPGRIRCFAFSPDGKTLATGHSDTTVLLWEIGRLRAASRTPAASLTAQRLEALWADLAAEDGQKAGKAIDALETRPREAAAFLKERVRPVAPLEPARLKRLLADLGSGKYAAREKAKRELQALGELALPALRALHKAAPSLDVERQAKWLLDRMEGPVRAPETVRLLRAVEVLERLGTAEAREALAALARGAPESCVTREARASLRRLNLTGKP
jgi:WD40 repeat protein